MPDLLAFDAARRTNSRAILDLHVLGYLTNEDSVLDCTYGEGRFWKLWSPSRLTKTDLYPKFDDVESVDFTALTERFGANAFDVTVFDPPYKLNGTPSGPMDDTYGVGIKAPVLHRLETIMVGTLQSWSVTKPGGYIIIKVQDQVVSGYPEWISMDVRNYLTGSARLVDMCQVINYRPQPKGRKQVRFRRNTSQMMVFRKER
jgi:hypothetical protein